MAGESHSSAQVPSAGLPCSRLAWFGDLEQAEFEIEFFERALARSPEYVEVLRALGEQLARKRHWERSLQVEQRLIRLRPTDGIAHYNCACSLAMQGDAKQALDALQRAIDFGYRDFGHLEVDPDLDSLRHLPEYGALVRRSLRDVASRPSACEVMGE